MSLTTPTAAGEVLFLTVEPLRERLAGPAIRALELARAVARSGAADRVALVSLAGCARTDGLVGLSAAGPDLPARAAAAAAVVVQGDVLNQLPWLAGLDVPVVVDVYDPFHLEQLEQTRGLPDAERLTTVRDTLRALNGQLARADLVLCASSRQRALWLGQLAALGRLNPLTYDPAPDLADLVAVVPFGTAPPPPVAPGRRDALRAVVPELADDDVLLVWGGGLYPWFDAETLLTAMARLAGPLPGVKLLFLGTRHPMQPDVESPTVAGLRAQAAANGTLDRTVFFHEGWVPYDERHGWLAAGDVGVSTHHLHLETEFSYRTRVVDYLAAGLPVLTTDGDALADLVRATGAGVVVPPGDVDALAAAISGLAGDPAGRRELSTRASAAAGELDWDLVAAPLVAFCRAPRRAPDLVAPAEVRALLAVAPGSPLRRVRAAVAEGGPRLLAARLARRLRPGR
ncbi:glycosyltransferase [Modestobacter versicolor]|uniref:glycosyltransferase n=1 Tax=Modestobacter versicolor TaxID=429133 RepID=UPI0034DF2A9C